jgi:NADPH:quinone reductase-like Zn-dependent oxidoreductase
MKAISQSLYGTPDVLRSELIPAPRLDGKSLRVRVTHSAVTAGDLRLRSGDFPGITWLPGRLAMGLWKSSSAGMKSRATPLATRCSASS